MEASRTLILATHNQGKVKELREPLARFGFHVESLRLLRGRRRRHILTGFQRQADRKYSFERRYPHLVRIDFRRNVLLGQKAETSPALDLRGGRRGPADPYDAGVRRHGAVLPGNRFWTP